MLCTDTVIVAVVIVFAFKKKHCVGKLRLANCYQDNMLDKTVDMDRSVSPSPVCAAISPTRTDGDKQLETAPIMRKSISMDSGEAEVVRRGLSSFSGSIKRRSIRRRSSKRLEKQEESYGNDTEGYDGIRTRVLKEKAVVNAIEALQERWRMIMFMYDDCVELNEGRKDRVLKKLCVKRQEELILIILVFVLACIPVTVLLVILCR